MTDKQFTLADAVRNFWPMLRPQCRRVVLAFAASLLAAALTALAPLPVRTIIDQVLAGRDGWAGAERLTPGGQVMVLALVTTVLATLAAAFSAAEKLVSARARERMTLDLRLHCLDRVLALTPLCREDDRSGELGLRLVDDVQQVARLFTKTAPVILRHTLALVFALAALAWISPTLGAAALAIVAVLAVMVRFAAAPLRVTAAAKRVQEGRVAGAAQEILRSLSFIQASAAQPQIRLRFEEINVASVGAGVDETRAAVRLERAMQIANGLAVALIVGAGGWLALQGRVSAGDLAVAVIYLNQMLRPIEKINELASAVTGAVSRAARLSQLLGRPQRLPLAGTIAHNRAAGRLSLGRPVFAYSGGGQLDFGRIEIPAGATVSIEGPSGSGKSTLAALLLRLFDPDAGSLALDGIAYPDWDIAALRRQFAISPQSPPLMSGTVRDWMQLGLAGESDETLLQGLAAVALDDVIAARGGLDLQLGEAGGGLSGGEQARLALARALAANRPVLLLDEPFANVDPRSASVMRAALAAERGRRTIVIVTHQALPDGFADIRLRMAGGRLSQIAPATSRAAAA